MSSDDPIKSSTSSMADDLSVNNDDKEPFDEDETPTSAVPKKYNKKRYRKDPDAPTRFKSAFIFFTQDRHKTIREEMERAGVHEKTPNIAKIVAEEWRTLAPDTKANYEEMARKDKQRYEIEKSLYTGPWKVPHGKGAPKDPTAPKRPMSSYLSYSNERRSSVQRANPELTSAEISALLARMWKEAPEREKQPYIDREAKLRQEYLIAYQEWKQKNDDRHMAVKNSRQKLANDIMDGKAVLVDRKSEPMDAVQPEFPADTATTIMSTSYNNMSVAGSSSYLSNVNTANSVNLAYMRGMAPVAQSGPINLLRRPQFDNGIYTHNQIPVIRDNRFFSTPASTSVMLHSPRQNIGMQYNRFGILPVEATSTLPLETVTYPTATLNLHADHFTRDLASMHRVQRLSGLTYPQQITDSYSHHVNNNLRNISTIDLGLGSLEPRQSFIDRGAIPGSTTIAASPYRTALPDYAAIQEYEYLQQQRQRFHRHGF